MSNRTNGWIAKGQGLRPSLRWSFRTDAPLIDMVLAREAGDVILADESDALYRLDRCGDVASVNRGIGEIRAVAWADTGAWGYLLQGENELTRVNRQLEAEWVVELPEAAMGLSCTPYGHHVAVGLVDGKNRIYDSEAKLVCEYETARPLSFLAFLASEPAIVGAAEYGLLCRHTIGGECVWDEKLWSNVGGMVVSGDGKTILLAGFMYGIQTFDGRGQSRSSFVVEGTAHRASMSVGAERIVAATLEGHLYWLDSEGALLWAANAPEGINQVACDPLGEWLVCAFASGRTVCLDWSGAPKGAGHA